ncbi:MAG: hypothetical protein ACR2HP_12075 [Ilumatobacteraceae bacterium]
MPDSHSARRDGRRAASVAGLMRWGARAAWLAVAVIGGRAVGAAVADRSAPVQLVASVGAWTGWAAGAVALIVPSVATLTLLRAVVPGALAVAVVAACFGAGADDVLALGVPALVAALLVTSAETGREYLQASAYGDERRFGLRPPLGYLAACVVTWVIWVAAVIAGPLALAAKAWALAAVAVIMSIAGVLTLPRRWHQLSRRWLVLVPAGVVVHDPVVLDETLMVPRRRVVAMAVAELGRATAAGAADLTGPTPGLAVEIVVDRPTDVALARRPRERRGRQVSFEALLVSPTRPGAVLAEASRRRLTVASATPPPST